MEPIIYFLVASREKEINYNCTILGDFTKYFEKTLSKNLNQTSLINVPLLKRGVDFRP